MTSPYHHLNNGIVSKNHLAARRIMRFAEQVVDTFYDDLNQAAASLETYSLPFCLLSYDKVTFGDPSHITNLHKSATVTGDTGTFLSFPDDMTANDVLAAFTLAEDDLRTALMMLLINLREVWDEGASRGAKQRVEQSLGRLKALLGYSLSACATN